MYLAVINGLSYDIYAVGKTEPECLGRILLAFRLYVKQYGRSVEEWIECCGEDFAAYDYDLLRFLQEYYGCGLYDISKGYAFGWE